MENNYLKYMYIKPHELEQMLEKSPIAIVPFGALEWHAEHNILGVDSIKAIEICKRVIQKTLGVSA